MLLHKNRLFSLILAGALAMNLSACGQDADSSRQEEPIPEQVSVFGVQPTEEQPGTGDPGALEYINTLFSAGADFSRVTEGVVRDKKLFLFGERSEDGGTQSLLMRFSPDSGQFENIALPKLSGLSYIQSVAISPEGESYWALISQSSQEDTGSRTDYSLLHCDLYGQTLGEISLADHTESLPYFCPQALHMEPEGTLLVSGDSAILRFDSQGALLSTIELGENVLEALLVSTDGRVYVRYFDTAAGEVGLAPLEADGLSAPVAIDPEVLEGLSLYPGFDGCLLASDSDSLMALNPASGALRVLSSWVDCDVNPARIGTIIPDGEGGIYVPQLCQSGEAGDVTFSLSLLTEATEQNTPSREVLTFGAAGLSSSVRDSIIAFNQSSDQYRVTVLDYSVYNTETDQTLGEAQLLADILAGNGPDLFLVSDTDAQRLMAAGALADLHPLIQQDTAFSMEELLSAPLQDYRAEDSLYAIPTGFSLNLLCASSALTEGKASWSLSEMAKILRQLGNTPVTTQLSPSELFWLLLSATYDSFVDTQSGTCSFDSDDFRSLLEIAGAAEGPEAEAADQVGMVSAGEMLLLVPEPIVDYKGIRSFYSIFSTDSITSIGDPGSEGNLRVSIEQVYAVSGESTHKEGAWSFLRSLLSDSTQSGQLPVTCSGFERVLEQAMDTSSLPRQEGCWSGGTEYLVEPISEALAEDFAARLDSARSYGFRDPYILDLATEIAEGCFDGSADAETISKAIQEQVSQYLAGDG